MVSKDWASVQFATEEKEKERKKSYSAVFKGRFADKHRLNLWFLFPWLSGLHVTDEKNDS